MGLVREATIRYPGPQAGDMKIAHYAITYTSGTVTSPSQDPLWMLLNGAHLSTTTYPLLFALFGYTYGGSGTTFWLPDLTEGRLPIGKGLTNFTALGAAGGEATHALTTAELAVHGHTNTLGFTGPTHGHSASAAFFAADSHQHNMPNATSSGDNTALIGTAPFTVVANVGTNVNASTAGESVSHGHTGTLTIDPTTPSITKSGTVLNAGSGTAHNNMQPYVVVGGWLVKFG